MYARPILAPLDPATSAASCCRVVLGTGDNRIEIVNEPLCPFPAPTDTVCVQTSPLTGLAAVSACAYPT